MLVRECYISNHGISCLKNNNIINTNYLVNIKNNIIFYLSLRITEFLITDYINNINIIDEEIKSGELLEAISFS